MGLRKVIGTLLGDVHVVKALCLPPNIMVGEGKKRVVPEDYRSASKWFRPGDVLTSRTDGYIFSNWAIPGAFKHAMLYVGPIRGTLDRKTGFISKPKLLPSGVGIHHTQTPRAVVHAVSEGVVCQDLLSIMNHCDYIAAFRPVLEKGAEGTPELMCANACALVGSPYDFGFSWEDSAALSCTELVDYVSGISGFKQAPRIKKRVRLFGPKNDVVLADNFMYIFKMVWCSVSCNSPAFIKKALDPQKMRDAIYRAPDASQED